MPLLTETTGSSPLYEWELDTFAVSQTSGTLSATSQPYIAKVGVGAPAQLGIIYCHGAFSNETEITGGNFSDQMTTALARRGFPVIAGRLAGDSWGNDASRLAFDDCRNFLISDLNAYPSGLVGVVGVSMGAATALSWVSQHNSLIAGFVGIAPLTDIQAIYDSNPLMPFLNIATSIETAYASAGGWAANASTHDPADLAAAGEYDNLPSQLWFSSADEIIPAGTTQQFATEVGATARLIDVGGLHFNIMTKTLVSGIVGFFARLSLPTSETGRLILAS